LYEHLLVSHIHTCNPFCEVFRELRNTAVELLPLSFVSGAGLYE
jgi:hypothetical protein